MTKRNLRNLYWFSKEIVYILFLILPFICYALFYLHQQPSDLYSFVALNFIDFSGSFLFTTFSDVFNLMFDLSTSDIFAWFSCYFIIIELVHISIDLIILLPNIIRRFLRRLTDE